MKTMKKFFAFMLVLCMVFALCACGEEENTKDETEKNNVETDANVDDKKENEEEVNVPEASSFKVTVKDENGNPVSGVMIQVCKDICLPAITDAEGIATLSIEIEEGHKLQVSSCPEGYTYEGEAEIYLEAGATEYELSLKTVQ